MDSPVRRFNATQIPQYSKPPDLTGKTASSANGFGILAPLDGHKAMAKRPRRKTHWLTQRAIHARFGIQERKTCNPALKRHTASLQRAILAPAPPIMNQKRRPYGRQNSQIILLCPSAQCSPPALAIRARRQRIPQHAVASHCRTRSEANTRYGPLLRILSSP